MGTGGRLVLDFYSNCDEGRRTSVYVVNKGKQVFVVDRRHAIFSINSIYLQCVVLS